MVKQLITIALFCVSTLVVGQTYEVSVLKTSLRGSVFSPAYFNGSLVVCSDQKDRLEKTILDSQGHELVDLYSIHPEDSLASERFDHHFRTDFSDGPISFDQEAEFCVVSRNIIVNQSPKNFEKNFNHLALFYSSKQGGEWQEIKPLPFNSNEYNCTHPALSMDGKTLVFSSNMPGGSGGYDLWTTNYNKGKWSEPKNLGPVVNTDKDELFPTVNNGTIYFSSNRGEFGGLDLYSYSEDTVTILPTPLNSDSDDFGIISSNNLDHGFFSSNRDGKDDGIYEFEFIYPVFDGCDTLVNDVFCYTLYEENAMDLGDVNALIYQWTINEDTMEGVSIDYCFPGPGAYEVNLDIVDTVIKKTYFNEAYYYIELEYTEQPFIESPDTVAPDQLFSLNGLQSNLPNMLIDEYYWDFGDGTKAKGSEVNHLFKEPGTYEVVLGVLGYESEIPTNRCVYKKIVCYDGEVSSDVIVENLFPSKAGDSTVVKEANFFYEKIEGENGDVVFAIEVYSGPVLIGPDDPRHQVFSELEYRIDSTTKEQVYRYLVGEYASITDAHSEWQRLVEKGIDEAIIRSLAPEYIFNELGETMFVMEDLQFDSDKWAIRDAALPDLNKLLKYLENNPTVFVRVDAHTDATATASHNLTLSINRANSVKSFLVNSGIDKSRIKAEGHGEQFPIASNKTEEGKQTNRRVEFTLYR